MEHLIAIALQAGRAKNFSHIPQFIESWQTGFNPRPAWIGCKVAAIRA
jgi:hypothetical protein